MPQQPIAAIELHSFVGLTSYSCNGTKMHKAHVIQNGLYAKKNNSAHRLLGFDANHKLPAKCTGSDQHSICCNVEL